MTFHFLELRNFSIYEQLLLEEHLLRTDRRNFCIVNYGSTPAIVMGISGKPAELIDREKTQKYNLPIIKRFSGGGTVVIDEDTLFITFISEKDTHSFPAYPEPILKWSESIYKKAFPTNLFHLKENDYVIGEKKCGGNAQYIKKERWLHHTSFLWDYKPDLMGALLYPKKTPSYRAGRNHMDFLCTVKEHFNSKEAFVGFVKRALTSLYAVKEITIEELLPVSNSSRRTTTYVSF